MLRLMTAIALVGMCQTANAQRWIELQKPGVANATYVPVAWENVTIAVVKKSNRPELAPKGIALYILSNGEVKLLGTVPDTSASAPRVRQLLAAEPPRWLKGSPTMLGSFQRPEVAEAFINLQHASEIRDVPGVIELGSPAWRVSFPGNILDVAVYEQAERDLLRASIEQSMQP